jgi:hypothetical protein
MGALEKVLKGEKSMKDQAATNVVRANRPTRPSIDPVHLLRIACDIAAGTLCLRDSTARDELMVVELGSAMDYLSSIRVVHRTFFPFIGCHVTLPK